MKNKNHDNKGEGRGRSVPDFVVSGLSSEAKPLSQPG